MVTVFPLRTLVRYQVIFRDTWASDLRARLVRFLDVIVTDNAPTPEIYALYSPAARAAAPARAEHDAPPPSGAGGAQGGAEAALPDREGRLLQLATAAYAAGAELLRAVEMGGGTVREPRLAASVRHRLQQLRAELRAEVAGPAASDAAPPMPPDVLPLAALGPAVSSEASNVLGGETAGQDAGVAAGPPVLLVCATPPSRCPRPSSRQRRHLQHPLPPLDAGAVRGTLADCARRALALEGGECAWGPREPSGAGGVGGAGGAGGKGPSSDAPPPFHRVVCVGVACRIDPSSPQRRKTATPRSQRRRRGTAACCCRRCDGG